jgi:Cof subfamily protein (haloacid dehalogenase superfamily)
MPLFYKLLCVDLDGTLITKTNRVSKTNLKKLDEYVKAGGEFALVTGRSFFSANKIANKINNFTKRKIRFIVCSKGAYIYDTRHNSVTSFTIPHDIVKKILDYCLKKKISMWAYTEKNARTNVVYANNRFLAFLTKFFNSFNFHKFPIGKAIDLSSYKLNIFSFNKKRIADFLYFLKIKFKNEIDITTHGELIEITLKNINKGSSLKHIAQVLKLKKENIASIGDSNNDIEMFKESGFNFAIFHSELLANEADIVYKKQKNAVAKAIDFIMNENEK